MGSEMTDIERMAEIALTICKVNMTPEERNAATSFSDCHDSFDANVALYGAYCGNFFAEPFGEDGERKTEILNQVGDLLDSYIKEGKLK